MTSPDVRKVAELSLQLSREDLIERIRAQQAFSEEALKALVLVNGGALVALFTLVGAIAGKGAPLHLVPWRVWTSFGTFSLALFATLLTYLFSFLSQAGAYEASLRDFQNNVLVAAGGVEAHDLDLLIDRATARWRLAVAAAIGAALLFMVGAGFALAGFLPG